MAKRIVGSRCCGPLHTGKGPRQHPLHWKPFPVTGPWSDTRSLSHTPGTQAQVASLSVALSQFLSAAAHRAGKHLQEAVPN
jgi:hypothetical protein